MSGGKLARALSGLVLCGCSAGAGPVTRIVDGQLVPGRYISPEAYASYVRARYLEAHGDLANAARAYGDATERDPDNPDAWTRLGAVHCQLSQRDPASRAFERAARLSPASALLWREKARCAAASGDLAGARSAAERAAAYEPTSVETSLLLVSIYDRLQLPDEATRWLDALVVWQRGSAPAWQAAFDHAARRGDRRRLFDAARHLLELRPDRRDELGRALPEVTLRSSLDAALLQGRLGFGRSVASEAGVSASELAIRAAALGQLNIAREQAELVLAADPTDGDAWIARLAAAPTAGATPAELRPPRSLSIRLLAVVLRHRIGPSAAAAWLSAWSPLPEPADELEVQLAERLAARD